MLPPLRPYSCSGSFHLQSCLQGREGMKLGLPVSMAASGSQSLSEGRNSFCFTSESPPHVMQSCWMKECMNEWLPGSAPSFPRLTWQAHLELWLHLRDGPLNPAEERGAWPLFSFLSFCSTPPGLMVSKHKTKTPLPKLGFSLNLRGLRRVSWTLMPYNFKACWNYIALNKTTADKRQKTFYHQNW